MDIKTNTEKNQKQYDAIYKNHDVTNIVRKLDNLDSFLKEVTSTDTSWVGLYQDDFQKQIKGKKILEIGCGDCVNAAVMAALGAEVYANDISQVSGIIVEKINENCQFDKPIIFVDGDFLESNLPENSFDFIIGKAFVHHLTLEQEVLFTEIIVRILKPNGSVRYFEPAVNNKFIDELRFLIPVPGRPSKLSSKFRKWKENDPHPDRDNSSKHYKTFGKKYFHETKISCIGALERLHRILPHGKMNRAYRKWAFKAEKFLPNFLTDLFARGQLIVYKNPIKKV